MDTSYWSYQCWLLPSPLRVLTFTNENLNVSWHMQSCNDHTTKKPWRNVLTFAKHILNTSILTSHLNPNKKIWIYFWQLILFIQTCPAYFVTHLALVMDNWKISIDFSIWKDQQGCTLPLLLSNWADRVNWRVVVFLWECWKDCLVSPSLQLQLLKTMSNQFTLQECQVRFESNKLTKRTLYLRGPLDLQPWSDLRI